MPHFAVDDTTRCTCSKTDSASPFPFAYSKPECLRTHRRFLPVLFKAEYVPAPEAINCYQHGRKHQGSKFQTLRSLEALEAQSLGNNAVRPQRLSVRLPSKPVSRSPRRHGGRWRPAPAPRGWGVGVGGVGTPPGSERGQLRRSLLGLPGRAPQPHLTAPLQLPGHQLSPRPRLRFPEAAAALQGPGQHGAPPGTAAPRSRHH